MSKVVIFLKRSWRRGENNLNSMRINSPPFLHTFNSGSTLLYLRAFLKNLKCTLGDKSTLLEIYFPKEMLFILILLFISLVGVFSEIFYILPHARAWLV